MSLLISCSCSLTIIVPKVLFQKKRRKKEVNYVEFFKVNLSYKKPNEENELVDATNWDAFLC